MGNNLSQSEIEALLNSAPSKPLSTSYDDRKTGFLEKLLKAIDGHELFKRTGDFLTDMERYLHFYDFLAETMEQIAESKHDISRVLGTTQLPENATLEDFILDMQSLFNTRYKPRMEKLVNTLQEKYKSVVQRGVLSNEEIASIINSPTNGYRMEMHIGNKDIFVSPDIIMRANKLCISSLLQLEARAIAKKTNALVVNAEAMLKQFLQEEEVVIKAQQECNDIKKMLRYGIPSWNDDKRMEMLTRAKTVREEIVNLSLSLRAPQHVRKLIAQTDDAPMKSPINAPEGMVLISQKELQEVYDSLRKSQEIIEKFMGKAIGKIRG